MSKKPVMSHDPLAGGDEEIVGDVPVVPDELSVSNAEKAMHGEEVLVLPESMTIADVGDFNNQLSSLLVDGGSISIDGGGVETIDSAGLQLLVAFVKDLIGRSSVVTWVAVSDVLQRSSLQMGVSSALQIDRSHEAA